MFKVPTHYNYETRKRGIDGFEETLTDQEAGDRCETKSILERYRRTGMIDHVARVGPHYGDIPPHETLAEALNTAIDLQEAFGTLDAETRREFLNDPIEWVEYLQDPANKERIEAWGIDTTYLDDVVLPLTGDLPEPKPPEPPVEPRDDTPPAAE